MPNVRLQLPNVRIPGLVAGTPFPTVDTGIGAAVFASDDYDDKPIRFRFETEGAQLLPPEPIIQEIDRPGAISLTPWVGQKPYRMQISVRFDRFPNGSVEEEIHTLEHFAEVHKNRDAPPTITVEGAVPQPRDLRWKVTQIADPEVDYVPGGTERCRYATVVSLVQHVTDRVLLETLRRTSRSKGVKPRSWEVRADEDSLFDVARHAYKDPSRASDIARANDLHLGARLKAGTRLRLP